MSISRSTPKRVEKNYTAQPTSPVEIAQAQARAYETQLERQDKRRKWIDRRADSVVATLRAGENRLHPGDFTLVFDYFLGEAQLGGAAGDDERALLRQRGSIVRKGRFSYLAMQFVRDDAVASRIREIPRKKKRCAGGVAGRVGPDPDHDQFDPRLADYFGGADAVAGLASTWRGNPEGREGARDVWEAEPSFARAPIDTLTYHRRIWQALAQLDAGQARALKAYYEGQRPSDDTIVVAHARFVEIWEAFSVEWKRADAARRPEPEPTPEPGPEPYWTAHELADRAGVPHQTMTDLLRAADVGEVRHLGLGKGRQLQVTHREIAELVGELGYRTKTESSQKLIERVFGGHIERGPGGEALAAE